ncbi:zinc ribbon domain-containing protein [Haloarculaceae archaeon H-GB11]|nr:zinc ribbon domain-containing protein [Haloarculaceae archaeon H-GB11]
MLGVEEAARRPTFTGSTRAGAAALLAGFDFAPEGPVLVVVADCPRGEPDSAIEHAAGAGAVAFVVGPAGGVRLVEHAAAAEPYPGTRFRQAVERDVRAIDVRSYDRAAFVEPVTAAIDGLDADPSGVDAAAIHAPDGDLPYRAAKAANVERDLVDRCATVADLGDTGAASAPLSIARAVADGHDRILAVGYGSGASADGLVLAGSCPVGWPDIEPNELDYPSYLRRRGDLSGSPPAGGGASVSVPSWKRSLPQRHRLVAGQCDSCGALAFPPEGACPRCHELGDFAAVTLPRTGTVETVTTVGQDGAPPEFAPLQQRSGALGVTIVAFRVDDESVSVPLQVAADAEPVEPGETVATVCRHLYTQEGSRGTGGRSVRNSFDND